MRIQINRASVCHFFECSNVKEKLACPSWGCFGGHLSREAQACRGPAVLYESRYESTGVCACACVCICTESTKIVTNNVSSSWCQPPCQELSLNSWGQQLPGGQLFYLLALLSPPLPLFNIEYLAFPFLVTFFFDWLNLTQDHHKTPNKHTPVIPSINVLPRKKSQLKQQEGLTSNKSHCQLCSSQQQSQFEAVTLLKYLIGPSGKFSLVFKWPHLELNVTLGSVCGVSASFLYPTQKNSFLCSLPQKQHIQYALWPLLCLVQAGRHHSMG